MVTPPSSSTKVIKNYKNNNPLVFCILIGSKPSRIRYYYMNHKQHRVYLIHNIITMSSKYRKLFILFNQTFRFSNFVCLLIIEKIKKVYYLITIYDFFLYSSYFHLFCVYGQCFSSSVSVIVARHKFRFQIQYTQKSNTETRYFV